MESNIDDDILKKAGGKELIFALKNPKRFTDLLKELEEKKITSSTVNRRINHLLRKGIIKRTVTDEFSRGNIKYELTPEGKNYLEIIEYTIHFSEIKFYITKFMELYYKYPKLAEKLLKDMGPKLIATSLQEETAKKYNEKEIKTMLNLLVKIVKVFTKVYPKKNIKK